MQITYNNYTAPRDSISIDTLPSIIEIKPSDGATKASGTITLTDTQNANTGQIYNLVINGMSFSSTDNPNDTSKFMIAEDNVLTAYNIVELIRNSSLSNTYIITVQTESDGTLTNVISLEARKTGSDYNLTIDGTALNFATVKTIEGTSEMASGTIIADIYEVDTDKDKIGNTSFVEGQYQTTLSKAYIGEPLYFNLSPILSSLSQYGKLGEVYINLYFKGQDITLLTQLDNIYFTKGYMINQGPKYIKAFDTLYLAQNVSRGSESDTYNNTILYTYEPNITFSLFAKKGTDSVTLTIDYLNSAKDVIFTTTYQTPTAQSLNDVTISLSDAYFRQTYYMDVTIPSIGKIRYNVIKPLSYTDEVQRVYWRNSLGGISFFDFAGARTETRKTSVTDYQKADFKYHEDEMNERSIVYSKTVEVTVSLTSHNMSIDGTWQFFDLQNSRRAWTTVNGREYLITVTDLKVVESDVDGIYTGQIEYTYSLPDTEG